MTTMFAKFCAGRMHYGWVVLAVMFSAAMAGVGVRAAPGVMIVPLQHAFGWDVSTISAAVSINIILLGVTGPFLTGLTEVIGIKRTILWSMVILMAGSGLRIHDLSVASLSDLGVDGRHRLGRGRCRHCGNG